MASAAISVNTSINRVSAKTSTQVRASVLLLVLLLVSGCATTSYYAQAIGGHFELMRKREPVSKVIAAEHTDEAIRRKLQLLVEVRQYAADTLNLPDNDSYSTYVDLGRNYVTWNVIAAPEFSLAPKTWCFPVAGCVSYKGYFSKEEAEGYARELDEQGYDTAITGATAYSTLGWFDDPILNTMLRGSDHRLVGILFHELAHQKLYVKDDSSFNEAYASFVEQQGVRQWLESQTGQISVADYDAQLQRQLDFGNLLRTTRENLIALYKEDIPEDDMRARKQQVLQNMKSDYQQLKVSWGGYSGYDNWFSREHNNARLVAVATYRKWIPAFAALFAEAGDDFDAFYVKANELAAKSRDERVQELSDLLDR